MRLELCEHHEATGDRTGRVTGAQEIWRLLERGTATDEEVLAFVKTQIPENFGAARLSKISFAGRGASALVTAEYGNETENSFSDRKWRRAKRAGDFVWSFRTALDRKMPQQALELLRTVPAAGVESCYNPGCQLPAGGDLPVLQPRWLERCTATMRPSQVTAALEQTAASLAGKVNNAAFHGLAAGEVLFLGAQQSMPFRNEKGDWLCDVAYDFAIRRNVANYTMCGIAISGITGGWDGVYAAFRKQWNSGAPAAAAEALHVVRLYDSGDFSLLGLGNSTLPAILDRIDDYNE